MSNDRSPVGCVVLVIEDSHAMGKPWAKEAESKAQGVFELLEGFLELSGNRELFRVTGIGYRSRHSESVLSDRWKGLVPPDACTHILGEGDRPQQAAFAACWNVLEESLTTTSSRRMAAVVVHLTTGTSTDGSPENAIRRMRALRGSPLVFHVHLLPGRFGSAVFCREPEANLDARERSIFELSSPLPREAAADLPPGSRGMLVRARKNDLARFLDRVSRLLNRWACTRVLWSYPESTTPETRAIPVRSCAVTGPSDMLYALVQGQLVALTASGEVEWSWGADLWLAGSPALGNDGSIRVHSREGFLHCVSASGTEVWRAEVGLPLVSASPVLDEHDSAFLNAYDNGLIKVDSGGRIVGPGGKYLTSQTKFDSTGLIHEGVYYVGGEDQCLHAIKLREEAGEEIWDHHTMGVGRTRGVINSAVCMGDGPILVVASQDDCLYGFSLDGKCAWHVHVPGRMLGSPVLDKQSRILVGAYREGRRGPPAGMLLCIDPSASTRNKIVWKYETEATIESTPVIGDDLVYFGDSDGTIHALDLDGRKQWTEAVHAPVRSLGALPHPNLLVFGLDDGRLVALECSARGLAKRGWPGYLPNGLSRRLEGSQQETT